MTNLFKYWTYRVFAPGAILQSTYKAFQELLACDGRCHELMAELEELYYQGKKEDFCKISRMYAALAENVKGMVTSLDRMSPGSYVDLQAYFRKFDFYSRFFLAPPTLSFGKPFVLTLSDPAMTTALAGSKTTTLVKLSRELNLTIPEGFVITTNCFSYLLEYNNLRPVINELLASTNIQQPNELNRISTKLRKIIENSDIPRDIEIAVLKAGATIAKSCAPNQLFAIRSSALNEDEHCSFAGQYDTFLNISIHELMKHYLKVVSSKYSPEALAYRINSGLSDEETPMAVMVVTMIDPIAAGVIYTADPSGIREDSLFIHATGGLGDGVVSGTVNPDVFTISRTNVGQKNCRPCKGDLLSRSQLNLLKSTALKIESHFNEAQDIEWAIDQKGTLIFLQCRALRIYKKKISSVGGNTHNLPPPLFTAGVMAASGICSGNAWCPDGESFETMIPNGAILIIDEPLPSYVKMLSQVSGVIARSGHSSGHFATVCREFGIPLLLGVGDSIQLIAHGQAITLSANDTAAYSGIVPNIPQKTPGYICHNHLPFYKKLRSILDFVTPLKLVDPNSQNFSPESCRSFHDIIRFSHEKAVQAMFSIGERCSGIKGKKKKLQDSLPFDVYLVDVDGGLEKSSTDIDTIPVTAICSTPFLALWRGLNHPDITWENHNYYNWKNYDQLAMSDAFVFQSKSESASYAVLGKHYLNMNIRFGYHFTVLDTLCEPHSTSTNYLNMRFAGGGGEYAGRELRLTYLTKILTRLNFKVSCKGDLLDAKISGGPASVLEGRIETLGKLLGLSKQMDIRLKNAEMVNQFVDSFFIENNSSTS